MNTYLVPCMPSTFTLCYAVIEKVGVVAESVF
jgi:hypothetical protein